MLRSMFAGVSGLRNHQIRMDIIGNNVANVNTIGFKKSRVTFQEALNQTIRGASSSQGNRGGTNPQQVGLGMTIGSIDTIHTPGSIQTTGKITDMAIEGDGFFILADGEDKYYTRAGNFDFDEEGNLVNPATGLKVLGWDLRDNVNIERTAQNLQSIEINKGEPISPKATDNVKIMNNLDAGASTGDTYTTFVTVYDSLGHEHELQIDFTKGANPNEWDYTVSVPGGSGSIVSGDTGGLGFTEGKFDSDHPHTNTPTFEYDPANGAANITIDFNFDKVTQFASDTTVTPYSQDGYPAGTLKTISVDTTGTITGVFSNGINKKLAQVAMAVFDNPGGLLKMGQNLYKNSNNSGMPRIGTAGTGGRGTISPGSLEMSNVDISEEFVNMIITQRGFQANSRIITTSDEMLQELINLKR